MVVLSSEMVQADGGSVLVVGAIIYAFLSVIGKIKRASQPGTGESPAERSALQRRATELPRGTKTTIQRSAPGASFPPHTELSGNPQFQTRRLEEMLRALGQGGSRTEGPLGRPAREPLPEAEEVEERGSLEVAARVSKWEEGLTRSQRQVVDFDDEAETIIQRRIAEAEQRDRPRENVDHQSFDARIRQVAADKTAVAKKSRQQIRDAFVWSEILGPPGGIRE
ncbi:MAG: hypothetical protein ABI613_06270 [Gemmatimonadota bacterium]